MLVAASLEVVTVLRHKHGLAGSMDAPDSIIYE